MKRRIIDLLLSVVLIVIMSVVVLFGDYIYYYLFNNAFEVLPDWYLKCMGV